MATSSSHYLHLRLSRSDARVRERLRRICPAARFTGDAALCPLGEQGVEEILAACHALGLRIVGSRVGRGARYSVEPG